jgi:N-acetylmuramoyl-L-alanine amidase
MKGTCCVLLRLRKMREIKRVILHCSATPEGKEYSVETIRKWHTDPKPGGRGWSDIGYHFVIHLHGVIESGRPFDKPGAHTRGENRDSIGVCYIGGVDENNDPKDTMNECQEEAFRELVYSLRMVSDDHLTLHGHNEFSSKACPSFQVNEKFKDIM